MMSVSLGFDVLLPNQVGTMICVCRLQGTRDSKKKLIRDGD